LKVLRLIVIGHQTASLTSTHLKSNAPEQYATQLGAPTRAKRTNPHHWGHQPWAKYAARSAEKYVLTRQGKKHSMWSGWGSCKRWGFPKRRIKCHPHNPSRPSARSHREAALLPWGSLPHEL